jgi:hypothetical protein
MSQEIQVTKTCNPTPFRGWDFQATLGEPDLDSTLGMGATPEEAIQDLKDQLEAK